MRPVMKNGKENINFRNHQVPAEYATIQTRYDA